MLTPEEQSALDRDVARGTATAEQLAQLEITKAEEFKLRLMRIHAIGCDDGTGWCKYCGTALVQCGDDLGHPFPLCDGPPHKCSSCGGLLTQKENGRYEEHTCETRSVVVHQPLKLERPRRTGDNWYERD